MSSSATLSGNRIWELAVDARTAIHGMYDDVGGPLYAEFCASDRQEFSEYAKAIRHVRGDVLELAAGAGRLTLPLLAMGRKVVATELSPTMLTLLEDRLRKVPETLRERCEVILADMCRINLGRTFGAVVLGTTSISLLDAAQRAEMFKRVKAHLADDGVFLVSTLDLSQAGRATESVEHLMTTSTGTEYVLAERVSPDRSSREVALAPRLLHEDGSVGFICLSKVAVLTVDDLTREAAAVGLTLQSVERCVGFEERYLAHLLTFAAERPL